MAGLKERPASCSEISNVRRRKELQVRSSSSYQDNPEHLLVARWFEKFWSFFLLASRQNLGKNARTMLVCEVVVKGEAGTGRGGNGKEICFHFPAKRSLTKFGTFM